MATNTVAATDSVVLLDPTAASLANILWRWVGVRAVPHLPCRFDCHETIQLGSQFLQVGEASGHVEEAAWIKQILSWPVEWSALHGIAEVKSPVLKISTRTDASANKYVVRWKGTDYPKEGATGLRFPYQAPARRLMTEGRSFQLGLRQALEGTPTKRPWFHRDNGFSSPETMNELHRPIVSLARRALHGLTGSVLDLGCGNAALLAKICREDDSLTPYGVDSNKAALEHAAALLPAHARNFKHGNVFDCDSWSTGQRYVLTLLMAGRLFDVDRRIAERLIARLRADSDWVLLYVYPGSGTRQLAEIANEFGFGLQDAAVASVGLLEPTHVTKPSHVT